MNQKRLLSFLFVLSGVLWLACQNPANPEPNQDAKRTDVNPNGSSELAKMMREMTDYQKSLKAALEQDELPEFPEYFYAITGVGYTEGIIRDKALFDGFAAAWLTSMETLHASEPEERHALYKLTVEQCLACHSQHCQGPIPMIKGLL
jgi:hypothetical protein